MGVELVTSGKVQGVGAGFPMCHFEGRNQGLGIPSSSHAYEQGSSFLSMTHGAPWRLVATRAQAQ